MKYKKGVLFFNGPLEVEKDAPRTEWARNMVVLMNDIGDTNDIAELYSLRDKKTLHLKAFNLAYHFHRVQEHA